MRLLLLGDIHGQRRALGRVLEFVADATPDLVLLTGDLTLEPARAQRDSVDRMLGKVLAAFPGVPLAFIPGNHDIPDLSHPTAVNVDGRVVPLAGLRVAGFGGAGPTPFGFPYEWTEDEADRRLGFLDTARPDVWLCHTPPRASTLDRLLDGTPVGSQAIADWIRRAVPPLFVCGHIHEADGVERISETLCVNAGALGPPHQRDLAYLVEWQDRPVRVERRELVDGQILSELRWSASVR